MTQMPPTNVVTTSSRPVGFLSGIRVGPTKPTLPNTFTARVECNLLDLNRSTDVIEYYDFPHNRGAIYQTEKGMTGQIVYNYDTNELFIVDRTATKSCVVDELTEDNNDFLFGYKQVNQSTRIFSPSAALRFGGKIVEKYLGKSLVRGIVVEGWQSCSYWPDMDATSKVTWYFSDASEWTEAIGGDRLPVRCEIVGKSYNSDGGSKSYHHIYEFTHFRPYIDANPDHVFEAPKGMYCENRKSLKALPISPQYFHFEAEIVVPQTKIVSYIAEWYDYTSRLVRYDYSPFPSDSKGVGLGRITEIHDFNTGVKYVTNTAFGNCTVGVIDPNGFDTVEVNPHTVRLRNPNQFFDLDGTFQYEGVHRTSRVDCDGWVSKKKSFPPVMNETVTEWLLTTGDWMVGAGNDYQKGVPKKLKISSTDGSGLQYVYNIFNYRHSEPAVWDYNIRDCFRDAQTRHLQFLLDASYRTVLMKVYRQKFEYALYQAIRIQAVISPVRVTDLQVDYNEQGIEVTFTLLDVAPITGDVQQGSMETPLDVAAENLFSQIRSGQFVVTVPHKPNDLKLKAKPDSGKTLKVREWLNNPIPRRAKGYRPGDMAAVALVMLIVGAVIGCGIVIMIYRKNGGSFFPKPYQAEKFDLPPQDPK
ncbi:uncharacterized protein LOC135466991 [Liolophura sinensis]|uniref:uncharacterized protein LOC135466991 n=1 Tax=Liolophura sinensis TaxID=3198878 RepID=UPI0031590A31